jgi:hypothetical protein
MGHRPISRPLAPRANKTHGDGLDNLHILRRSNSLPQCVRGLRPDGCSLTDVFTNYACVVKHDKNIFNSIQCNVCAADWLCQQNSSICRLVSVWLSQQVICNCSKEIFRLMKTPNLRESV